MKTATFVLVVGAFALLFAGVAWRSTFWDSADGGLIVMPPTQAQECREGGGCAAFSQREIQGIARHAATIGFETGLLQCPGGGI
ncbi:MAG: hypothetical protein KGL43_04010 [Burkholderiales bacterium]|nr:hypothetical protein [Burkholderiales bacterium]MDE2452735.1 hypothetical protein [Burkholderiales bacterium]